MKNFGRSNIDWCDIGFNAYTGCLHGCSYCYAEGICNRFKPNIDNIIRLFYSDCKDSTSSVKTLENPCIIENSKGSLVESFYPFGFEPTYRKYFLQEFDEYLKKLVSKNCISQKDINIRRYKTWSPLDRTFLNPVVFISPLGDIMGNWVDKSIIQEHIDLCEKHPNVNFVWLTKNPNRYKDFYYPYNCWLGTTVTRQEEISKLRELTLFNMGKNKLFISFEPLLEKLENIDVASHLMEMLSWVIIGCQTGKDAKPYDKDAVKSLIQQARECDVPIFLKDNLKWHEVIKEFPQ